MSETKRGTPPVNDLGFGGAGKASNTSYPENLGGGTAPAESVATSQELAQGEAQAALREFDEVNP